MIYSKDINKICAVCRHSEKVNGNETHIVCKLKNEYKPIYEKACSRFVYDILKKPARRKKRLTSNFNPEDFQL